MCEGCTIWDKQFGIGRCWICAGIDEYEPIDSIRKGLRWCISCTSLHSDTHPQYRICRECVESALTNPEICQVKVNVNTLFDAAQFWLIGREHGFKLSAAQKLGALFGTPDREPDPGPEEIEHENENENARAFGAGAGSSGDRHLNIDDDDEDLPDLLAVSPEEALFNYWAIPKDTPGTSQGDY